MKITKNRYLMGFAAIVILLALVRLILPSVAAPRVAAGEIQNDSTLVEPVLEEAETKTVETKQADKEIAEDKLAAKEAPLHASTEPIPLSKPSEFFNADGSLVKHRILSVPSYKEAFPDSQSVQYASARRWGVESVQNRQEAESRKRELVFVGSNPYFFVDKMNRSIPYLVPRAAVLLNDIGRAFFDSLQMKQVPLQEAPQLQQKRHGEFLSSLRHYVRYLLQSLQNGSRPRWPQASSGTERYAQMGAQRSLERYAPQRALLCEV